MSDSESVVLAHWYTRLDTFSFSTQEFYERLVAAISHRKIPNLKMSRVALSEGGLMSHSRDYLRIERGELSFDVCAAPFGIDFFVSWWVLDKPGCLSGCLTVFLPFVGSLFRKTTYYKEDTAIIFREAVHQAVLETVDEITKGSGQPFSGNRVPETRKRLL
jgi:hypothetical protein